MKKSGAMLVATILAFALAAPAAAQVPAAADGWTGATWSAVVDWLGGWADGVRQVFGASTTEPDGGETNLLPEQDPNGLLPEQDPNGLMAGTGMTSDSTGGLDPDG